MNMMMDVNVRSVLRCENLKNIEMSLKMSSYSKIMESKSMMTDFVQQTIEQDREGFYESCNNCDIKSSVLFDMNDGKICCGHVRYPTKKVSFDKIRLCIVKPDEYQQYNFTPDEALEIVSSLAEAVNQWMYNTKEYKKFRKLPIQSL